MVLLPHFLVLQSRWVMHQWSVSGTNMISTLKV